MTAFTDDHLPAGTVSRAREGSAEAREAIYRAFEVPVRSLARRLVPGSAQAEDLAQDVFVEVLTSIGQYEGRGSFAGWVRAITVRRCLMHLRSPWRHALRWARAVDDDGTAAVPPVEPASGCEALDLERALARLGDTARAVVWLHDVEGCTHAEIGALLGGTASLSKSQLARAHARLRELLEPEGVKTSCMHVSTNC
jgi:RNA polymerase sigma-70 factor (ECF subfamily)